MKPINCSYIYSLGQQVGRLSNVKPGGRFSENFPHVQGAYNALKNFRNQEVYALGLSKEKAFLLMEALEALVDRHFEDQDAVLVQSDLEEVSAALTQFETVLQPEWDRAAVFAVSQKRGYDSSVLIWDGLRIFAPALEAKVPDACEDLRAATRCVAFELPTAAAFHICRGFEAVVRRYYEEKLGALPQSPGQRTLGELIKKLEAAGLDARLMAALRDLKSLHRNPAMHPERSLESVDEAIALLSAVDAPITYMLNEIKSPSA